VEVLGVVDTVGVVAAVKQAIAVLSGDVVKCEVAAIEIDEFCRERNWRPRFGGKYEDHLKGKVGEIGFWKHANLVGNVGPEGNPFPAYVGEYSLKHDFSFVLPDRRLITVEVKTGWVAGEAEARAVDVAGFGLMVPVEQLRPRPAHWEKRRYYDEQADCWVEDREWVDERAPVLPDIYVYNLAWRVASREYRVVPVGWCHCSTVTGASRLRRDVPHPCYQVLVEQLRPMDGFYGFIKTGSMSNAVKTENVAVKESEMIVCQ
jgi:hypothetical protein